MWEPTQYNSACTQCGTTNFSKPAAFICVLSATKNIWLKYLTQKKINIGGNDDLQGDECIRPEGFIR